MGQNFKYLYTEEHSQVVLEAGFVNELILGMNGWLCVMDCQDLQLIKYLERKMLKILM